MSADTPPLESPANTSKQHSSHSQETHVPSNHTNQVHAHHLKWGNVETSGFAPPTLEPSEEHVAGTAELCHSKRSPEDRRAKMTRDHTCELLDSEARKIHLNRRYLFRRPRPLQYFRGKVLVRSEEERGSGRLELFFDLTFVGIIAVLAQSAVADPTGPGFVRYLITYTAAYMIWNWMRETVSMKLECLLKMRI